MQGKAFKEYRLTYSSLIKFGNKSEGEKLVNNNANTNSEITAKFFGCSCVTNQMATPQNAII
jgi:hypothetical protein